MSVDGRALWILPSPRGVESHSYSTWPVAMPGCTRACQSAKFDRRRNKRQRNRENRQALGSFEARFRLGIREEMSSNVVYAIVKAGGRQEKVSVGDVVVVDKLAEEIGSSIELQPLMLVDGDAITVDAAKLDKVSVKAEVVDSAKGPKISIIKYKNKSGYRKRQGHRQKMSVVKITEIA